MGIRYVGETTAKSIARHFGSIDTVAAATVEELLKVEDIGRVIAESVFDYFQSQENLDVIARLKTAGLKFETEGTPQAVSAILEGKTIVVSGNFSVSRDEMKALVTAHGGKCSGSVSGKTSYLLAGEKAGPEKLKKAEALGIQVISESEFRQILGEADVTTETLTLF